MEEGLILAHGSREQSPLQQELHLSVGIRTGIQATVRNYVE